MKRRILCLALALGCSTAMAAPDEVFCELDGIDGAVTVDVTSSLFRLQHGRALGFHGLGVAPTRGDIGCEIIVEPPPLGGAPEYVAGTLVRDLRATPTGPFRAEIRGARLSDPVAGGDFAFLSLFFDSATSGDTASMELSVEPSEQRVRITYQSALTGSFIAHAYLPYPYQDPTDPQPKPCATIDIRKAFPNAWAVKLSCAELSHESTAYVYIPDTVSPRLSEIGILYNNNAPGDYRIWFNRW